MTRRSGRRRSANHRARQLAQATTAFERNRAAVLAGTTYRTHRPSSWRLGESVSGAGRRTTT